MLEAGSVIPAGQNGATAVYNSQSGDVTLFGGMGIVNGTCQATNAASTVFLDNPDVALVENSIPEGTSGAPPPRSLHSAVYDSTGNRMLIFGGLDSSGNYLNDVWSLGGLGPTPWTALTPTGGPPAPRAGQAAVFDSSDQRMTVFGGNSAGGVLNDSWLLNSYAPVEFSCTASGGVPNLVSAEGITEQMGDIVLNCLGGKPTRSGESIPEYTISLTLNSNVTGSLLPEASGLTEALLTIDEPFPASPIPPGLMPAPGQPPQILCSPLGSECSETGTGGTPSPYQTQPNVFVGKHEGASTLYWKVPIDPPTSDFTRVIRITNVRANASQLGLPSGLVYPQIQATVEIQGSPAISLIAPEPGVTVAVSTPGAIGGLISSAPIPQCEPHNAALLGGAGTAAFDFSVQSTESFAWAFQYRNLSFWGRLPSTSL